MYAILLTTGDIILLLGNFHCSIFIMSNFFNIMLCMLFLLYKKSYNLFYVPFCMSYIGNSMLILLTFIIIFKRQQNEKRKFCYRETAIKNTESNILHISTETACFFQTIQVLAFPKLVSCRSAVWVNVKYSQFIRRANLSRI